MIRRQLLQESFWQTYDFGQRCRAGAALTRERDGCVPEARQSTRQVLYNPDQLFVVGYDDTVARQVPPPTPINLSTTSRTDSVALQGCLAHKKTPLPMTLM